MCLPWSVSRAVEDPLEQRGSRQCVRPRPTDRDVPELPPRRSALSVQMEVCAAGPRAPRRCRERADRFTMALCPRGGRSEGQRRDGAEWFSNWLVSEPSIVQCPELCTRGAISLASSRSPDLEQLDREHADVAELVHDARRVGLGRRLELRRDASGAGAIEAAGCPPGDGSRPAGRSGLPLGVADGDDRQLAAESARGFDEGGLLPYRPPHAPSGRRPP